MSPQALPIHTRQSPTISKLEEHTASCLGLKSFEVSLNSCARNLKFNKKNNTAMVRWLRSAVLQPRSQALSSPRRKEPGNEIGSSVASAE